MNRSIKTIFNFQIVLFLCLLCSCGPEEPEKITEDPINIEYEFPLTITQMIPVSPIALPDGLSFEGKIINSENQLTEILPTSVIKGDKHYNDIDFRNHSVITLKYRMFYNVKSVETKFFYVDEKIVVKQLIHVLGPLVPEGYFVMSNFISDKLPENMELSVQQSFSYE